MIGAVLAQSTGVSGWTQAAVIVVTISALVGAVVAARAARSRTDSIDRIDPALLDVDLLDPGAKPLPGPSIVSWYERAYLAALLGYAMFDRAFAWLHVPGTPIFIGEVVLGLGLVAFLSVRTPMRRAFRASSALVALSIWMAWGAALLGIHLTEYGLDAVRDSAIWYYGLVGVLAVFLLIQDPTRLGRWNSAFARVVPILLLWFPIAILLDILFANRPPYVPDSTVSIFVHRFGNIGVFAAAILGFLWLVDRERGRFAPQQRIALSAIAVMTILLVGFQNRGGMVSAFVGIALMIVFLRSRRGELVLAIGAVIVSLASLAIVTDVTIPLSGDREISAAQMIDNIGSIIDPNSGGQRQQSTTQWRLELWTAVLDDVVSEHPIAGFGPGLDLGLRYGVSGIGDEGLRNPHNSHLSVVARMGLVGFALWVLMWIAWGAQLLLLRSRLRLRGRTPEAGFVEWLLIFAVMILTNAIFDPTLEGPQVAFWLWTIFGVGAGMTVVYSGVAPPAWIAAHIPGSTSLPAVSGADRFS